MKPRVDCRLRKRDWSVDLDQVRRARGELELLLAYREDAIPAEFIEMLDFLGFRWVRRRATLLLMLGTSAYDSNKQEKLCVDLEDVVWETFQKAPLIERVDRELAEMSSRWAEKIGQGKMILDFCGGGVLVRSRYGNGWCAIYVSCAGDIEVRRVKLPLIEGGWKLRTFFDLFFKPEETEEEEEEDGW
jgi:hypothetical protein